MRLRWTAVGIVFLAITSPNLESLPTAGLASISNVAFATFNLLSSNTS